MPTFPVKSTHFSGGSNLTSENADSEDLAALLNALYSAIGALGGGDPPRTITGDDTARVGDTVLFVDSALGPITLDLLPAASFSNDRLVIIHSNPVSTLTIEPDGAETINLLANAQLAGDGTVRSLNVISDGSNYFIF